MALDTRIPNVHVIDPTYFVGVDLGQRGSHTAFVVVERFEQPPDFTDMLRGAGFRTRYVVRLAERVPLGTPYADAISRLKMITGKLAARGACIVVVDESGAGIPIVELMRKELSSRIVAITITSGQAATQMGVPRAALITKMQVMAEREELEIPANCRDTEALKAELVNLSLQKTGDLDDIALGLCLACWRAKVR